MIIGSLSNDDGDGNENGKKKTTKKQQVQIGKTTTLHVHAFLFISQPSLHTLGTRGFSRESA